MHTVCLRDSLETAAPEPPQEMHRKELTEEQKVMQRMGYLWHCKPQVPPFPNLLPKVPKVTGPSHYSPQMEKRKEAGGQS